MAAAITVKKLISIHISRPLRDGRSLEGRRELNQLEELPHVFVNEGRIRDLEISEALGAFEQHCEYNFAAVTSFASRLDGAIDLHGTPQYVVEHMGARPMRVQTEMIVNFRIWEIIQYVWKHSSRGVQSTRRSVNRNSLRSR